MNVNSLMDTELVDIAKGHIWRVICDLQIVSRIFSITGEDNQKQIDAIREMSQNVDVTTLKTIVGEVQGVLEDHATPQDIKKARERLLVA